MSEPTECWLPVTGYEGSYEVSDQGRVRSLPRTVQRLGHENSTLSVRGKYLRRTPRPDGYLQVALARGATSHKSWLVHRLVLVTFVGPCPHGMESCHNNGTRSDNRLINLRWDTMSGNMFDKKRHGTDHQLNKTHCPKGHEYTPENTYSRPGSRANRHCRACIRAKDQARTQGLGPDWQRNKTHCPRGHEYNEVNTRWYRNHRYCRECMRIWNGEAALRRKRRQASHHS